MCSGGLGVQPRKARVLELEGGERDVGGVGPGDLPEAAQAEQQVFKAVSRVLLRSKHEIEVAV